MKDVLNIPPIDGINKQWSKLPAPQLIINGQYGAQSLIKYLLRIFILSAYNSKFGMLNYINNVKLGRGIYTKQQSCYRSCLCV